MLRTWGNELMLGTWKSRHRARLRGQTRQRHLRPALEGLETRELLTAGTPVNGGEWVYGSRITYSFVPDGTSVGGIASNLNSRLTSTYGSTWQNAIQKAAALWSAVAEINLALVSDDGSPTGVSGQQEGDPRFGDIRISMIPQSGSTLAFAMLPPPINGGTNAGDIVFNSNVCFGSAGYDLTTVAIHEFGHALGLDHSTVANDVMYAYYNGTNQAVSSADGTGLAGLYGPYTADPYNDGTVATATPITLSANGTATITDHSIDGTSDVDWFSVVPPSGTNGTLTVTLQTNNLSSAAPRVVLFANNGTTSLAQATAPNVYGTSVTATASVIAGTKYFIKVLPASTIGAYGSYGLLVSTTSASPTPVVPPNTTVAQQPDQGGSSLADTDGNGLTLLQRVAADINQGISQIQSQGYISLSTMLTSIPDFAKMLQGLSQQTAQSAALTTDARNLVAAIFTGLPALQLAALQDMAANIVQVGTITTFGDNLTVSEYRESQSTMKFPVSTHHALNLSDYKINLAPTNPVHQTATSASTPLVIWTAADDLPSISTFGRSAKTNRMI